MTETKFTKGPWKASWPHPDCDDICHIVVEGLTSTWEIATLYDASVRGLFRLRMHQMRKAVGLT